jgi:hypothetical protein
MSYSWYKCRWNFLLALPGLSGDFYRLGADFQLKEGRQVATIAA